MQRSTAIALGAGALLVGALVAVALFRRGTGADVTGVPLTEPMSWPPGQVSGRNNLVNVRRELQEFFAWWNSAGPFAVRVTSGLRTDAQQRQLYAQGRTAPGVIVTHAQTASDSAHGRGAACDAYPFAGGKLVLDTKDPRWKQFGEAAEAWGLVWGGRWTRLVDYPHVEVPGWRSLPVPNGGGNVA